MHVEVSATEAIVNAVKTAFCLHTSTGTMTFVPRAGFSESRGMGKQMINVYIEG